MYWKSEEGRARKSSLIRKGQDGTSETIAEIERLPSGEWEWRICAGTDIWDSHGIQPTETHAHAAVERIVVPDRILQYLSDTLPWEGAAEVPAGPSFVATGEVTAGTDRQDLRSFFAMREIDPGTKIVGEHYTKIDDIPVLCERWNWEGVTASSLVVPKQYLPSQDEASILALFRRQVAVPDDYTFSNDSDSQFVFVNYDILVLE